MSKFKQFLEKEGKEKDQLLHACIKLRRDIDLEYMRLLIEAGADVNTLDEIGLTPLCSLLARRYGVRKESRNYKLAEMLLKAGARIDIRAHNKSFYPLLLAFLYGNVDISPLFLHYYPESVFDEEAIEEASRALNDGLITKEFFSSLERKTSNN